jgi:branched-chain amino acid transport system substrate-binding protein
MTFFSDPLSIPEAKKVVKVLQEKWIKPTGYTLNSYAAVQAIEAAIKNSPRDKMSNWLHENKVNSVIGTLEWDHKGDLKKAPFIVYKWNDEGEYEPYWIP